MMLELQRVLFATDFSDRAGIARELACELSSRFGAELHALHVDQDLATQVPEFGMGLSFPGFVDETGSARSKRRAEITRRLQEDVTPSWQADSRLVFAVRFGAPFVEIIRYAREHDVDLIVVGSHGRTGIAHLMLGSVAERVVRKASCPVLTVRPPHEQSGDDHSAEAAGKVAAS